MNYLILHTSARRVAFRQKADKHCAKEYNFMPDTILIEGLEFYGYHGVPDEEQAIGHRYGVSVRLTVDTRSAAASDNVKDTTNYSKVARALVEIGTTTQCRLLERLAAEMVEEIFARFEQVQAVNLCLRKLLPPMNVIVSAVGVEITRQRVEE